MSLFLRDTQDSAASNIGKKLRTMLQDMCDYYIDQSSEWIAYECKYLWLYQVVVRGRQK